MNLENGSPSFRVVPSSKFEQTAKRLKKDYKGSRLQQAFMNCVAAIVDDLTRNPRLENSRLEPIPKGVKIPSDWEFRKLVFLMPGRTGAFGDGRLMYLINYKDCLIRLVWIYTHEEFAGRPPDKNLKQLLREILSQESEE